MTMPDTMGMATLMNKKSFTKNTCIETKWVRIPMVNTYEMNVDRRYMIELIGRDPLSQKTISLSKAEGSKALRNRDGNPIYLASYLYPDSTSSEELKSMHASVVQAIEADILKVEGDSADLSLRKFIEDFNNATNSSRRQAQSNPCIK